MNSKKLALVILAMVLVIGQVFALQSPISVRINDEYIKLDQDNLMIDDEVYVVAREVAEILGVEVTWDPETGAVALKDDDMHLVLKDNMIKSMRIDAEITLEADYFFSESKLYVPARLFEQNFGARVNWVSRSKTVNIYKEGVTVPENMIGQAPYDEETLLWLARIVDIEARGGSVLKKIAVANVVLNRVNSQDFPNTVYDVIKQKGQFPPAYYSYFDTFTPREESFEAAERALLGEVIAEDCLYFNLKPFSWKSQEDFYKNIEGDYFYR